MKNKITFKDIEKFLIDCKFNPNKIPGSIRFIVDTGNPTYWEMRAKELITQAAECIEKKDIDQYYSCLKKAVQLLTLALCYHWKNPLPEQSDESFQATQDQERRS